MVNLSKSMIEYFDISEFDCSETGQNRMEPEFLERIDELRRRCGFPFVINSGYRAPEHSIERVKLSPGFHSQGIAADVRVRGGWERGKIIEEAVHLGFKGIGVAEKFVHVDLRDSEDLIVWVYGA